MAETSVRYLFIFIFSDTKDDEPVVLDVPPAVAWAKFLCSVPSRRGGTHSELRLRVLSAGLKILSDGPYKRLIAQDLRVSLEETA